MKKIVFTIAALVIFVGIVGFSVSYDHHRHHKPTPQPTYTLYPTYTPRPTYTPYPTFTQPVKPTATARPTLNPGQKAGTAATLHQLWCPIGVCYLPTSSRLFPPPLY
jgi:hypothetical protein